MPNWCSNILEISGDPVKVKEVRDTILIPAESGYFCDSTFDFNLVVPMPQSLNITSPAHTDEDKAIAASNLELYGSADWYDWCNRHWGTKWNACNTYVNDDDYGFLRIEYETAWGPAQELIEALVAKFPYVNYRHVYLEPGCEFAGEYEYTPAIGRLVLTSDDYYKLFEEFYGEAYQQWFDEQQPKDDENGV